MIHIQIFNGHPKHRIKHTGTIAAVRTVVKNERCGLIDLNVVFVDDKRMIAMNGAYLKHRYTTDVLCFPLGENGKRLEGEVYVNLDQAQRQALQYNVSFREEYLRLIIHGVLHLLGYGDKKQREKNCMTNKESFYLSKFKFQTVNYSKKKLKLN
jgi:probable rRNA maturation factor